MTWSKALRLDTVVSGKQLNQLRNRVKWRENIPTLFFYKTRTIYNWLSLRMFLF